MLSLGGRQNVSNQQTKNLIMADPVSLYAQAGFCVFDLDGKTPTSKEWQFTKFDPNADREKHPGNFGVLIGQDYLIIDIDIKNSNPGIDSFHKLSADAGLPRGWETDTYVVKTGTGGFHIYLKKPNAFRVKKNPKGSDGKLLYPGIDFLSGNAFVVGAGSIHPVTRSQYVSVIDDRSPKTVSPAPATILNLIEKIEQVELGPKAAVIDDDPINVERFIEILKTMPVVTKGNQRNSCYVVACKGRDLGLSQAVCASTLHTHYNGVKLEPAIQPEEVDDTVKNAYRYAQGTMGGKNVSAVFQTVDVGEHVDKEKLKWDGDAGNLKKTLNNAVNHLLMAPGVNETFRYNVFTGMIEINTSAPWYKERGYKGENVTDEDIALLKFHLAKNFAMEYSVNLLWEAVIIVAHKKHYHPVQNFLKTLVWDGIPRLDTWLSKYAGAKDCAFTRAAGRKTLCAAVKRIWEPGCKWDYVLILEGAQGIGKSTLCRILGRFWGGDMNLDPHSKDSVACMLGKWVIELSEMTALRWADANALKSFITRDKDTVRLAYARHAKDFPRQSIFIGTVNPEHMGYLNDVTGNRRFWIVATPGPIKMVELENDANQIWAEAMEMYKNEPLYLSGEAQAEQAIEAQQRMPDEPYKVSVSAWIKENPTREEVSVIEILEFLGVPAKSQGRGDISRVANVLAEFGWERHRRREGDFNSTVYLRPLKDRIASAVEAL